MCALYDIVCVVTSGLAPVRLAQTRPASCHGSRCPPLGWLDGLVSTRCQLSAGTGDRRPEWTGHSDGCAGYLFSRWSLAAAAASWDRARERERERPCLLERGRPRRMQLKSVSTNVVACGSRRASLAVPSLGAGPLASLADPQHARHKHRASPPTSLPSAFPTGPRTRRAHPTNPHHPACSQHTVLCGENGPKTHANPQARATNDGAVNATPALIARPSHIWVAKWRIVPLEEHLPSFFLLAPALAASAFRCP